MPQPGPKPRPVLERILEKVQVDSGGCWVFQGYLDKGYGRIGTEGQTFRVHRVTYELLLGPIPEGLDLDHRCKNRACCNPIHLEPVTNAENHRRGRHATKSHCKRGHSFAEYGTTKTQVRTLADGSRVQGVHRACRACARDYQRQRRLTCATT